MKTTISTAVFGALLDPYGLIRELDQEGVALEIGEGENTFCLIAPYEGNKKFYEEKRPVIIAIATKHGLSDLQPGALPW